MDHRSIMSGKRRGPFAMICRAGLWLASIPYGVAVRQRNRNYDRQTAEIQQCGVPVISVGNLTTGGTGKTPIVCLLAKWFRQRGIRVSIVSRGYGRGNADANDEAMELHARLPDVPHVQDPDRVAAARLAVEGLSKGFHVQTGKRDIGAQAVDEKRAEREPDSLLEILGLRKGGKIQIGCQLFSSRRHVSISASVRPWRMRLDAGRRATGSGRYCDRPNKAEDTR